MENGSETAVIWFGCAEVKIATALLPRIFLENSQLIQMTPTLYTLAFFALDRSSSFELVRFFLVCPSGGDLFHVLHRTFMISLILCTAYDTALLSISAVTDPVSLLQRQRWPQAKICRTKPYCTHKLSLLFLLTSVTFALYHECYHIIIHFHGH